MKPYTRQFTEAVFTILLKKIDSVGEDYFYLETLDGKSYCVQYKDGMTNILRGISARISDKNKTPLLNGSEYIDAMFDYLKKEQFLYIDVDQMKFKNLK